MITPEQKAIELYNKMYALNEDDFISEYISKATALIAVEEILKRTRSVDTMPPNYQKIDENTKEYWQQVKIELQKLCK